MFGSAPHPATMSDAPENPDQSEESAIQNAHIYLNLHSRRDSGSETELRAPAITETNSDTSHLPRTRFVFTPCFEKSQRNMIYLIGGLVGFGVVGAVIGIISAFTPSSFGLTTVNEMFRMRHNESHTIIEPAAIIADPDAKHTFKTTITLTGTAGMATVNIFGQSLQIYGISSTTTSIEGKVEAINAALAKMDIQAHNIVRRLIGTTDVTITVTDLDTGKSLNGTIAEINIEPVIETLKFSGSIVQCSVFAPEPFAPISPVCPLLDSSAGFDATYSNDRAWGQINFIGLKRGDSFKVWYSDAEFTVWPGQPYIKLIGDTIAGINKELHAARVYQKGGKTCSGNITAVVKITDYMNDLEAQVTIARLDFGPASDPAFPFSHSRMRGQYEDAYTLG